MHPKFVRFVWKPFIFVLIFQVKVIKSKFDFVRIKRSKKRLKKSNQKHISEIALGEICNELKWENFFISNF